VGSCGAHLSCCNAGAIALSSEEYFLSLVDTLVGLDGRYVVGVMQGTCVYTLQHQSNIDQSHIRHFSPISFWSEILYLFSSNVVPRNADSPTARNTHRTILCLNPTVIACRQSTSTCLRVRTAILSTTSRFAGGHHPPYLSADYCTNSVNN
jgi:hypothetical protein